MLFQSCAWHKLYWERRKFLGVAQWWPVWRIRWSHGICARCAAIVRRKMKGAA